MKLFVSLPLAVLCLAASLIESSLGAVIERSESEANTGHQVRLRRSPTSPAPEVQTIPGVKLSGGGSSDSGVLRMDVKKEVWSNDKTKVEAGGFAQRSWQPDFPSQNSFGAGATVSHRVWEGTKGQSVDVYGGYRREWNTPNRDNFGAGIVYRFR